LEETRRRSASTLLKAALTYARRSIPVFPCEPGGKRPLTYNGFWDATTDLRRVNAWWVRWSSANVAVPLGEKSGLLVLDVDSRAGGSETLAKLEWANGPLPRTARSCSGGGGMHIFFRYPEVEEVRNSAGLLGPGLDVRGEGGYVVVPAEPHAERLRVGRESAALRSGVASQAPE
jgi:Bifunctional DNA primase/polymerase, N-terminal